MRGRKLAGTWVLVFVMAFSMTGCGRGSQSATETSQAAAAQQEVTKSQASTVKAVVEIPNTQAKADELVGSWTEAADATRFANVTKTGEEYQFEDNEGKYCGTFSDGILEIRITETDIAHAYIDKDTGHMILTYGDNKVEYVRK